MPGETTDQVPAAEALRLAYRALNAIRHCHQVLARATDEGSLLRDLCQSIVTDAGYRLAWVGFAAHDEAKTVVPAASAGFEEGYLKTAGITWADTVRGRGPTGTAIRTGKPVIVRDTARDPDYGPWRAEAQRRGYGSTIALPLKIEGHTVGTLNLYAAEANAFDAEEVTLLTELADDLAYGVNALRARVQLQRLAPIADESPNPVLRIAADGRILYANRASLPVLSLWERQVGQCVPPAWQGVFATALKSGASQDVELVCEQRVFSCILAPNVSAGHVNMFGRDITERKQAEDALQRLTSRYEAILTAVPDIIMEVNQDKVYTWANRAGTEFFGDDVLGHEAACYFAGDQDTYGKVEELFSGDENVFYVESWQRRCDGEKRLLAWWCRALKDATGQVRGALSTARDITERKRAEDALRLAQFSIEHAADPAFWVGPDARLLFVNDAACRELGYTRAELLTKTVHDFDPGFPAEVWAEHWRELKRRGTFTFETTHRTKDGRIYPVEVTVNYLEFGGAGYNFAHVRNLTERKRAEQEQERLESQLRRAQKMEAVGQLAGGVAHDFNNILTAILGNVELLRGDLEGAQPGGPATVACLEQLERAAQRAAGLTRQLLAFSRQQTLKREALDLHQVWSGMEAMLRRLISENITLAFAPGAEWAWVRGDVGQIEQVIMNLVVNARDAMPGGGRLAIETDDVVLDDAYAALHPEARSGPHVMLTVSDTGCGMTPEVLDRIFEPFFTTKPAGVGTGLGLATVYAIVKQLEGHVMVYSEPGWGTTFRVYLPAITAPGTPPALAAEEDRAVQGSETILVCEDDETVRRLATQFLRGAGYNVLDAEKGSAALELAAARPGPIDLLVTDVIMPDINGRQLADALTAARPGLKTLFISGYTSDVIAHHGVLDAGVELLEKPFGRRGLLARVRELLDRTSV